MSANDVVTRMNQKYPSMSRGQKILAAYITDNIDTVAFLTAEKLGKEVGLSESTVVRFANMLGYKGYPQFQRAVEERVIKRLGENEDVSLYYGRDKKNRVLESVLLADARRIKDTADEIDELSFEKAVSSIVSSEMIYVAGLRQSAPLAQLLGTSLQLIMPNVRIIGAYDGMGMIEQLIHISSRDTLIAISFPRYSMRTLRALEFASSQNAATVTITDSIHSPMNLYSSCNLMAKTDMSSFIESLAAPVSLINALLTAISMEKRTSLANALDELENVRQQYDASEVDDIDHMGENLTMRLKHKGDINE